MPRPRRTILFKGTRFTIQNISKLDRHSKRFELTDPHIAHLVALTPQGEKLAKKKGQKLPKNLHLRTSQSSSPRTVRTNELIREGHLEHGGSAARRITNAGKVARNRKEIGYEVTQDRATATRIYNKLGAEKSTRLWLDGKFPKGVADDPNIVADRIIRKRFGALERAGRTKKIKGVLNIDNSHDFIIQAVIERLIGVHMGQAKLKAPKPNQGITIYHTREGKVIAEYAKRRFDVTKRFHKIMKRQL